MNEIELFAYVLASIALIAGLIVSYIEKHLR